MHRTGKDIENCKRERPSHILRQAHQNNTWLFDGDLESHRDSDDTMQVLKNHRCQSRLL